MAIPNPRPYWLSWRRLSGRRRMTTLSLPVFLVIVSNCRIENPDLTALSKSPPRGPDCASCHAYPPRDTNHVYHLFKTDGNVVNNRPITCLHCHANSIVGRDTSFLDSVFQGPNGNEFHSLDFPDIPEIRAYPVSRVETLVRYRPVAMPTRPGPQPEIREWVTAMAHLNGRVDIDFDRTSNDTSRFRGAKAVFNPKESTCSAMACHPNAGDYRWAIPSRNLPSLKGDSLPFR